MAFQLVLSTPGRRRIFNCTVAEDPPVALMIQVTQSSREHNSNALRSGSVTAPTFLATTLPVVHDANSNFVVVEAHLVLVSLKIRNSHSPAPYSIFTWFYTGSRTPD
ncbi:hypothetical protein Hypma_008268 [Hypsizygus marmoreus]|uniref:Uncharacterized protein n=1 Tax=Hypsizygus marmoreus TaxID=39966 RepID=A0A369JYA1_HYPMA|nr:hypothetical protein Hypma_008268 [Hypsizygus marmoreus]